MTLKTMTAALLVGMTALAACGEAPAPDGYDREVNRFTAGAGVISAIAKLCGAQRIDAYRTSFINKMITEEGVSPAGVARINAQFARADEGIAARTSDPAARAELCNASSDRQALIDRGIAGDFTGQI